MLSITCKYSHSGLQMIVMTSSGLIYSYSVYLLLCVIVDAHIEGGLCLFTGKGA